MFLQTILKKQTKKQKHVRMISYLIFFRHNSIFIDVYREIGVLEVFVTCLKRYKNYLDNTSATEKSFGKVTMEISGK